MLLMRLRRLAGPEVDRVDAQLGEPAHVGPRLLGLGGKAGGLEQLPVERVVRAGPARRRHVEKVDLRAARDEAAHVVAPLLLGERRLPGTIRAGAGGDLAEILVDHLDWTPPAPPAV